jgi:hypothetical protein
LAYETIRIITLVLVFVKLEPERSGTPLQIGNVKNTKRRPFWDVFLSGNLKWCARGFLDGTLYTIK